MPEEKHEKETRKYERMEAQESYEHPWASHKVIHRIVNDHMRVESGHVHATDTMGRTPMAGPRLTAPIVAARFLEDG